MPAKKKRPEPKDVDPKKVAAAMKRVAPLVKKLPKHLQLPVKRIHEVGLQGVEVVHSKAKNREEKGAPTVFGGDLIVDGSLDLGCICIVLGDLQVGGVIEKIIDDATLIVGGSIRARGINCTDQVHAGGPIEAEVVFVETGGKLTAAGGLTTELLVIESARTKIDGKVRAKEKVVLTYPSPKGLESLKAVLDPKAFGTVDGDDALYDYTSLFGALRRGKPWRRAAGRARKS